jgi:subtilisin-like proprotein convertase family protein
MKKLLLLTGLLICTLFSFAQVDPKERDIAKQLVSANNVALGLSRADVNDAIVVGSYVITGTSIRVVYLQQGYKGIPVYNQLQTIAFKDGKVVSNMGAGFVDMFQRTKGHSGRASTTVVNALQKVFSDIGISPLEAAVPIATMEQGKKFEFGKLGVADENIKAELVWFPVENTKEMRLAWQVLIAPSRMIDSWLMQVDAENNTILGKMNMTISCNWDGEKHSVETHIQKNHFSKQTDNYLIYRRPDQSNQWRFSPIVSSAGYRVVRLPAESPQHPGGTPGVVNNPWLASPGGATSLGWHFDGTVYHDSTRGNNVWAYEDRLNADDGAGAPNTAVAGRSTVSTTAQPALTFDDIYDFTKTPIDVTSPNQKAAITNLFYLNNMIHDLAYLYGFDEVGRNFQNDNQGRGGLGADYVAAQAQDGGGTNNANMRTFPEGTRPRMQMYLWNTSTPTRDGDYDNGVIAHEYTHGISNRLTGNGFSCLGSTEQMGEGWSDYFGLMMTQDWSTAVATDGFNNPRGIGTYALNQPVTGVGIRQFRYTTNMAVNPMTYGNLPTVAVPHGVGTIWCTALWDMTWEIIQSAGINPNIYNPAGGGGNAIALKLVTEGMRLQPCNPGFIDGRNAILKADTLFFGAQYSCAILRAFARRGMGVGASQGSSAVRGDEVLSFNDGGSAISLTQDAPLVSELQNITYTTRVAALCSPLTNYTVVDTLPTTVTYVSGGVYNNVNRTVTFNPVNVNVGTPQSYQFTVNVNAGTYFAPVDYLNDPVAGPPPAIPATWLATSTTANVWSVSATQSNTAPNAFFTPNAAIASHQILRTANPIALNNFAASRTILSFWHSFNTEDGWDGGVVEVSTNGGGTWTDLGSRMISGGYNGALGAAPTNQLSGRAAFTGNSGGFIKTEVNLSNFNGQNILIRFRFGSDDNTAPGGGGWFVDDVLIRSEAYISMRSNLFSPSMSRVGFSDTVSLILPAVCTPPTITQQPASVVRCAGPGSASFTVLANGTAATFQWEFSSNGGTTWAPIAGATGSTYSIATPTFALNGNLYRCVITGACGTVTSDAAVIYVSTALTHSALSATPSSTCAPGTSAITGTANGGTTNNTVIGSTGIFTPVRAIPDGTAPGLSSVMTLPALTIAQAANLKIRLNLSHPYTGDLRITLTSPCGTTFLIDRPGVPADPFGNGDNFGTSNAAVPPPGVYIFDIAGATIIPETPGGTGFITPGTYRPSNDAAPGVAHNWAGLTFPCGTAGNWTLTIRDFEIVDAGSLTEWAILVGGNYTHSLTGAGTIVQNAPTGTNNSTGNFTVSGLTPGIHNFTLVSTDILGCSVSSNVSVNVNNAASVTGHPADRVICAGQNTTFSATDNSVLPPAYQWQINQGSGFVDLAEVAPFSGVNTATLTITAAGTIYNGNTFRLVITNSCGTINSNPATLTVNPLPVVNVGPNNQCAPVVLTASGTSNTYAWTPATGLSATTGATVTASPISTTTYTVTGTITATGCQNSMPVTVSGTPAIPVITPAAPVICAGTVTALTVPASTVTFNGTGPITIPGSGTSTPYPATINVSGLPASGVTVKSITLNGVTHTFPDDVDVLVQSPTAGNVVLMSDAGGTNDANNFNYTFDDAAASLMSDAGLNPSGTYRPTNFITPDTWVAPGPGSVTQATPTLASLTGDMNGVWNLFVVDDLAGDQGSISSWSITFNVSTAQWSPATGLYTDAAGTIPYVAGSFLNTVYANPTATTTYTVTNSLGACNAAAPGTVTVTVNPIPTVSVTPNNQCGPVTLTASGTATSYTWSPAAGLSTTTGTTVIANPTANTVYTVTGAGANGCTAIATATVNATPASPVVTPASISICNGAITSLTATPFNSAFTSTATITIPAGAPANTAAGNASPYPAVLNISGLPVSGVRVKSVTLNGVNHTFPDDVDILLQSPTGTNVVLMSDAGGTNDLVNVNYTFDDAAASLLTDAGVNATGTYRPRNFGATDTWPAPGPGSLTQATPVLSSFTGNLNGNWNLLVVDDLGGDVGSISGWTITFEVNGAIWTPVTGLFTDATATIPYVAGTSVATVYARPATTTTYAVTRASVTCTSAPTNVTVTVLQPLAITTQPTAQAACVGATATFTTVVTGNLPSYQWQVNTGSGFTNIAGVNSASLVLSNVTIAMNGYQYRVIVSNGCFAVTSNAATLTVSAIPTVTATALANRICLSDTLLALTGTPAGGSWSGIGVSGNNFIPMATAVGTYTLTYTYTSPAGCVNRATVTAKVEDCPERLILLRDDAVILFPNPNNGRFFIRINSTLYNYLGMSVYTTAGQLVRTQNFNGLVFGRVIPIDLTNLPGATYMVKFFYNSGVRTSEKTFKVVVGK